MKKVCANCDCLFQLRVERCTVFRNIKSVNCARFAILDSNLVILSNCGNCNAKQNFVGVRRNLLNYGFVFNI